jgi:hypothetical protein
MPYNLLHKILNEAELKASVSNYRVGSGKTLYLYSEGTLFKSQIGYQLSLLRFFFCFSLEAVAGRIL